MRRQRYRFTDIRLNDRKYDITLKKISVEQHRSTNRMRTKIMRYSLKAHLSLSVFTLALTLCDATVFLRLPLELESEGVGLRTRRELPPAPEWRERVRQRAVTFGQSAEEAQRVHQYLERLNEMAGGYDSNSDAKHGKEDVHVELDSQLSSWSRRRLFDQHQRITKQSPNPEENGKFFEGDIILSEDQAEAMYESTVTNTDGNHIGRRVKRKFIGSGIRRWDTGKSIIYSFDGSHTLREQRVIELALQHWHNITCLNFERRNDEPKGNRIVFTDVDGCASNVGKHPLGEPQFVSLAPECIRLGVIAHEVAHALGFWHEQSRPDRDFFVRVRWENIDRDSKGQFLKEQPADVDNGGVTYDYGSIMHYRKAFAKYDDLFTMSTFISDYQRTIGQRDQLSFNDIRLMNTIYCKDTCRQPLACQRGGYTDPRHCDRCRCPDGFIGRLCDEVMPGYGAKCGGRVELPSDAGQWTRIQSPDYPYEFREGQECSWLLVAPRGQFVQLQFIGEFEMYCKVRHSLCMDYVEIRNSTDFANTGMRYCCYGTPTGSIVSATEDMLLLFRSFYRGGKGFQVQARAIPRTGRWTEWAESTPCSASCGACGVRQRHRQCVPADAYCLGNDTETEPCNPRPCSGMCTRKRVEDTDCTGFLSLLKGVRCKSERTRLEPCEEICCAGFSLIDGTCQR